MYTLKFQSNFKICLHKYVNYTKISYSTSTRTFIFFYRLNLTEVYAGYPPVVEERGDKELFRIGSITSDHPQLTHRHRHRHHHHLDPCDDSNTECVLLSTAIETVRGTKGMLVLLVGRDSSL